MYASWPVRKSLLEKWLEAGDAGDVEAFDEYLHADVIVHAPLGLSTQGIAREVADVGVLLRPPT
jgi:hypothetical protein